VTEGQYEMDKMTSEIEALTKSKCCLERALAEIENLLYIAQECLYYREKRYGIDQCHDDVENSLILVSIFGINYCAKFHICRHGSPQGHIGNLGKTGKCPSGGGKNF